MDFAFTDEQDALREGVRTVLDTECTPDALRAFEMADQDARAALSQNRWGVLAELGAPALVVPESADGLGLSDVDLVGVLEEAGRAGLPEPLLETAALAAPTLAALLPDRAASAALAALVHEDVSFAVGGIDVTSAGVVSPTEVSADGTLRTPRVVGARDAGLLLLAVRDDDSGWQLHAVPAASVTAFATPALSATRDLSTVHWPLAADTLLAYGVAAEAAVGLLADRAAAGSAALLIGLAERMLTMTANYAKERHQFGKPIGSFQAVKHLLADARVALEFARPATYRAAWSLATAQPTLSHDASMAKAMASDAADRAARVALQVHGAIGYTWECDLHFFLKQTWALARAWGDAATHRRLVLAQRDRTRSISASASAQPGSFSAAWFVQRSLVRSAQPGSFSRLSLPCGAPAGHVDTTGEPPWRAEARMPHVHGGHARGGACTVDVRDGSGDEHVGAHRLCDDGIAEERGAPTRPDRCHRLAHRSRHAEEMARDAPGASIDRHDRLSAV